MGVWLESFKVGKHVSSNGVEKEYTDADLKEIADNYNSQAEWQAPLVIGHPKTDDPAFGWVTKAKVEGSKLYTYVENVSDKVIEAVRAGMFKYISIALNPGNKLRHVGLLGAVPPAVKGLSPVQFSGGVEFEEFKIKPAVDSNALTSMFSRIKQFIASTFSSEKAEEIIPESEIKCLIDSGLHIDDLSQAAGKGSASGAMDAAFSGADPKVSGDKDGNGSQTSKEDIEMEQKLKDLETKFSEMNGKIDSLTQSITALIDGKKEFEETIKGVVTEQTAMKLQTDKVMFEAFCDSLIMQGKILPAEKYGDNDSGGLVQEFTDCYQADQRITYSEGEKTMVTRLKERLDKRAVIAHPTQKPFASYAQAKAQAGGVGNLDVPVEFAAVANKVTQDSLDFDAQVVAYAEEHKITYEEAFTALTSA